MCCAGILGFKKWTFLDFSEILKIPRKSQKSKKVKNQKPLYSTAQLYCAVLVLGAVPLVLCPNVVTTRAVQLCHGRDYTGDTDDAVDTTMTTMLP